MANAGRPCGSEPSTDTPARAARSIAPTTIVAPITAIRMPGTRLLPFSSRITARVPAPTRNAVRWLGRRVPPCDGQQVFHRAVALDREPAELRQLTDQSGQGNAVHVSITDRLGKEFGNEPQTRQAGQNAHCPGYDRHHSGQGDGTHGVAARLRQDHGEDDGSQGRVWSQHKDAGWDRTARRPAAEQLSRTVRGCPAPQMPRQ